MNIPKSFSIPDDLAKNPGLHCAALVVTENFAINQRGTPSVAQPSAELRNGTITFVKTDSRVFGITCWHVIEHYRAVLAQSGRPFSHSMRTMVGGFHMVLDRFVRPKPDFGESLLDVAIREINPDLVTSIGKVALDLDRKINPPPTIEHGLAVGFPEILKYKKMEEHFQFKVSMPQLEITAEISELPNRRFALFSELAEAPVHSEYSGMSGGPIFWTTDIDYGIFGTIYEGGVGSALSDGKAVYVYGESATPDKIKGWIAQIDA